MLSATPANEMYNDIAHRWILYVQGDADSNIFTKSSAADGRLVAPEASLTESENDAAEILTRKGLYECHMPIYKKGIRQDKILSSWP